MKFGQVSNPELVDFTLPEDHPETKALLKKNQNKRPFKVYVGCAKWNRKDLKGFYPRGTKDELRYYATQFNSIELNATFYHSPETAQVISWKEKTPGGFQFYPKVPNIISHFKRLIKTEAPVNTFCDAIRHFDDQLGLSFLQLHDNFKPKDFDRIQSFVTAYPGDIPLAVELRNEEWFTPGEAGDAFFNLLKKHKRTAIIVDTAGRRDMLHMRLTTPHAFIRYVGANHATDYNRLDDWLERIKKWRKEGLQSLHFFVHQNIEKASPLLSAYFIKKLNAAFDLELHVPEMPS